MPQSSAFSLACVSQRGRVRSDFQRCQGVPVVILINQTVALSRSGDVEEPRQQKILEHLVGDAERAGVPAEAVEGDGMWRDPAPAGPWVAEGLELLHLDRFGLADRIHHGLMGCGIDATRRGGGGIVVGQTCDPAVVVNGDAVGNRPQFARYQPASSLSNTGLKPGWRTQVRWLRSQSMSCGARPM